MNICKECRENCFPDDPRKPWYGGRAGQKLLHPEPPLCNSCRWYDEKPVEVPVRKFPSRLLPRIEQAEAKWRHLENRINEHLDKSEKLKVSQDPQEIKDFQEFQGIKEVH